MSEKICFFSNSGQLIYSRTDAIEFEHQCSSMTCTGSFPLTGTIPEVGQLVGWKDADGLWEIHEIISTETEVSGEQIEINGTNLAVSELSRFTIPGSIKVDNKRFRSAMETILGSRTKWDIGSIPTAGEDDPAELQRYRVTANVSMYDDIDSTTVVKTYGSGTYLNLVETTESVSGVAWWKMQAMDGREGWFNNPVGNNKMVRDGYKDDDEKSIYIEEENQNIWDLLNMCCQQTGYIVVPRVSINTTGLISRRYLDVKSKDSSYTGMRITCNTNVIDASVKISIENMYTQMIGIGKDNIDFGSITWSTSSGYPVDKPNGDKYISLDDKVSAYGIRRGVISFEEISNKAKLLYRTYEYLKSMSEPKVTISGTIADLYRLGYSGSPMHIYDTVYVILEPINVRMELKITDLTIDLVEPAQTNATIGSMDDDDFVNILATRKGKK